MNPLLKKVDSSKDTFLQIAEKVKQGEARVTCATMNITSVSPYSIGLRQTLTFEVQV